MWLNITAVETSCLETMLSHLWMTCQQWRHRRPRILTQPRDTWIMPRDSMLKLDKSGQRWWFQMLTRLPIILERLELEVIWLRHQDSLTSITVKACSLIGQDKVEVPWGARVHKLWLQQTLMLLSAIRIAWWEVIETWWVIGIQGWVSLIPIIIDIQTLMQFNNVSTTHIAV